MKGADLKAEFPLHEGPPVQHLRTAAMMQLHRAGTAETYLRLGLEKWLWLRLWGHLVLPHSAWTIHHPIVPAPFIPTATAIPAAPLSPNRMIPPLWGDGWCRHCGDGWGWGCGTGTVGMDGRPGSPRAPGLCASRARGPQGGQVMQGMG